MVESDARRLVWCWRLCLLLPLLLPIGAVWGPMLDVAWLLPLLLIALFCRSRPWFADWVSGVRPIAIVWALFTLLLLTPALAFGEFFKSREEIYRLILPTVCAWFFASQLMKGGPQHPAYSTLKQVSARALTISVCLYLLVGFGTVVAVDRDSLPSNAIPWAQGLAFFLAILLPMASGSFVVWQRPLQLLFIASATLGLAAIVLTESRGAYGAVLLPLLLLGQKGRWLVRPQRWVSVRPVAIIFIFMMGIALVYWLGVFETASGRLIAAYTEASAAFTAGTADPYNSSVGARIGLWGLGVREGLANLPWGVGLDRRLELVVEEGIRLQTPIISTLGHLHNQYLTDLLDYGLPGFLSGPVLIAGLVWVGSRLGGVAKFQLLGIALIHALGSLTNANFGHDFYSSAFGTSLALVILFRSLGKDRA